MIRDILVHVDATPESESRTALAAVVAKRLAADLTAVFVLPPSDVATWASGSTLKALDLELIDLQDLAGQAEAQFMTMLRQHDLRGRWILDRGSAEACMIQRALVADLVVLGQRNPTEPRTLEAPQDVIMACGRPVLMVPYIGSFAQVGQRPLLAWNDSREARRAFRDALPLVTGVQMASIIRVEPGPDEPDQTVSDLKDYFARRWIKTSFELIANSELTPAEAVLARASDLGADLIVMGAYGHSRTREMVLGGMTRDILREMTVPVLMSH